MDQTETANLSPGSAALPAHVVIRTVLVAILLGLLYFGVIMGVSISVIVLNTMWMTVLERTREIGVLRAVGWSRREVLTAVLAESVIVGCAALVVGALLGVALAKLIVYTPIIAQFVKPAFAVKHFVLAGAAAVVLSVLGGALPAWRAAQVSPAEALRYE